MSLDEWLRSHPFLDSLARVRNRVDAAVAKEVTTLPVPADWDEYVEDYAAGVPLLQSQMRIDLAPVGPAIMSVLQHLGADSSSALGSDAAALREYLAEDAAESRIVDWLLGDDAWTPEGAGLLRSVGWLTMSAAIHPIVHAFGEWRDQDKWLRRYCPTCGALPAMAHLVGVDPGRKRFMSCGRCESRWRYGRTECPFCDADSHRLVSVGVDGEGGLRIDYCESCRGYLKTYSGQGDEAVLLADWTSLHLDHVALARDLKKKATSLYDLETGGEEGIRTPGTREGSTVFKTAAIDRSATSPH
jgi:FdhE protein